MKIIIAGAGHGGLVAGALLAKAGHQVELYEKNSKENLGHDWEDRFDVKLLYDFVNKEVPWEDLRKRSDSTFYSPDQKTPVVVKFEDTSRPRMMWRKDILAELFDYYYECGGKTFFGKEIISAIVEDNTIKGVFLSDGPVYSDLVIDSLGALSAVRLNLPEQLGIETSFNYGEIFYAFRAYYRREISAIDKLAPFETFISHLGEQGISWYDGEGSCADVLIGRINPLLDEDIEYALDSFLKSDISLTKNILHGGQRGIIPVRRPLPLFVSNGYAAVGDSAYMTTPMNGMGIELCLYAGQILADTIIRNKDVSISSLWDYNRQYLIDKGGMQASVEILKNTLLNLLPEEVDFLFRERIITSSELSGAGADTRLKVLIGKLFRGFKRPNTFIKVLKAVALGKKAQKYYSCFPVYSKDGSNFKKWKEGLSKFIVKVSKRSKIK